jgi:hypothetical protein
MLAARGLLAAAIAGLALSACGSIGKPAAGRGRSDDARVQAGRLGCMRAHRLPVRLVGATGLQVGAAPAGPTVFFEPTPRTAEGYLMQGRAQGAELIGSALLYPNQAPDSELKVIEDCLAQGVAS